MPKVDGVLHTNVRDWVTWTELLLQSLSDQLEPALFPPVPKGISQFNFKQKNDFAVVAAVGLDSSRSLFSCLFAF